jgi:stage V sporulation protein B
MLGSLVFGEWLARGNTYIVGKESRANDALASSLAYVGCMAVLVTIAAVAWGEFLPYGQLTGPDYMFIGLLLVALVTQRAAQCILLGQDRQLSFAVIPLVLAAIYLVGAATALLLYESRLSGVLIAWSAAAMISALVAILMVDGVPKGRPSAGLLRRMALVGGRGAVSTTLIFLLFRSDVFLVAALLGKPTLGVYLISVAIAEMMQRFPNLAGVVLLPKVLAGKDDDHVVSLAVARRVLFGSALIAVGIIVIGHVPVGASTVGEAVIGLVFGPEFPGAFVPLVLMLPGLVACGFGSILNTKLAGEGYPPITIWAPAAALLTNVILNLVLIPLWGLEGTAISTSVAYILWSALVTIDFQRRTAVSWRQFIQGN